MIKNIVFSPLPVDGFIAGGIHCGIKQDKDKMDLAMIYCKDAVAAAGVFTQNITKAAPVYVSEKNLINSVPKAILINSGNANACTGEKGMTDALSSASLAASALGIQEDEVLVSSTGIIGVPLEMPCIKNGIQTLSQSLSKDGFEDASKAIMTTDTYSKAVSLDITVGGKTGRITGIAKGSGMIHPNMATMLGFIMTDVHIDSAALKSILVGSTNKSFNMISVDGDTSTNDMVLALASGSENAPLIASEDDLSIFTDAFTQVCVALSKLIATDGEGATKLIEMNVHGALSEKDAMLAAKSVISSSLVKSAFFGCDANWGRILCAMGYSGAKFNPDKVRLEIHSSTGSITLMDSGAPVSFDEAHALKVLSEDMVKVHAYLDDGSHSATAWGCDLTYEYVKINGEYRS